MNPWEALAVVIITVAAAWVLWLVMERADT